MRPQMANIGFAGLAEYLQKPQRGDSVMVRGCSSTDVTIRHKKVTQPSWKGEEAMCWGEIDKNGGRGERRRSRLQHTNQ